MRATPISLTELIRITKTNKAKVTTTSIKTTSTRRMVNIKTIHNNMGVADTMMNRKVALSQRLD